jgi:hypothetical protein
MLRRPILNHQNIFLRHLLSLLVICTLASSTRAQGLDSEKPKSEKPKSDKSEVLRVDWKLLDESKELADNTSHEILDGESVLKVVRSSTVPQLIPVLTLKDPKIKEQAYILRGKVRIEGVTADGFLEMWNHFPEPKPGAYFTRTQAENGPMGKLRGTAPWREFALPFMIGDASVPSPNKLQVNVYLPDQGTVWLSALTLEEMPVAKLQSELRGNAMVLPVWFWSAMAALLFIPILTIIAWVAVKARQKSRHRELGTELRRMKALDLT